MPLKLTVQFKHFSRVSSASRTLKKRRSMPGGLFLSSFVFWPGSISRFNLFSRFRHFNQLHVFLPGKCLFIIQYAGLSKKVIELRGAIARSMFNHQNNSFTVKRLRLLAFEYHHSKKFEKKLSQHGSNETLRSKSHISTCKYW